MGATGGGFILSKGVYTRATFTAGPSWRIKTRVNGDRNYDALTTRRAVDLLLGASRAEPGLVELDQRVEVPVGEGFGASAASALSAVLATAAALGLREYRRQVAYAAHVADIVMQTGLGTVSAIYSGAGAGVITSPGGPGVAKFLRVRVPEGMRLVTASLAPYTKRSLLSSPTLRIRVNQLGARALARVKRNPTLETLARSGERFATELGLETKELKSLILSAKKGRSLWASQNMLGYAIHCLVNEKGVDGLASSLSRSTLQPTVRIFDFGDEKARVLD